MCARMQRVPELIAVEGYSFGSKNAREQMGELGGIIRVALYEAGWPYVLVPPTLLKQFCTGKGNAQKNEMMRAVFKRWQYEAVDDNDADAKALAELGRAWNTGQWVPKAKKDAAKLGIVQL